MQGDQLLKNPDFAKTLEKSPFKPQDLPKLSTSIADVFQKMSPELRTSMKAAIQTLDGLSVQELKALLDTLDRIDKNKAQYPKIIAQLVQAGTIQQGDFPEKYDSKVMIATRALIAQAVLKKSGQQPPGYAKGGIVSLRDAAKKVQAGGRNGDGILAHINSREADMLKRAGGRGSVNPKTGLREYGFNWGSLLKVAGTFVVQAAASYFLGPVLGGAVAGGVSSLLSGGKPADALKSALIGGAIGGVMAGISSVSSGGGFFEGAMQGGSLTGSTPYETWLSKAASGTEVGKTVFPDNPADARLAQAQADANSLKPTGNTATGAAIGMNEPAAATAAGAVKPATEASSFDNLTKWASANKLPLIGLAGAGILAADSMTKEETKPTGLVNTSITGDTLLAQNPEKYGFNMDKFTGRDPSREVKPTVAAGNYVDTPMPNKPPPNFYDYSKVQYPNLFSSYQQPQYAQSGILSAATGGSIRGPVNGPGTSTSDSIPARLSDGEFVMTARAVRGAGNGDRKAGAKNMYDLMHKFERRA